MAFRLDRGAAAEVDELLERRISPEAVGHSPCAAAAEDDETNADSREPFERPSHVSHLFVPVDVGTGDFHGGGQKQVGDRRWKPELTDARDSRLVLAVGQRGDFRRGELDVLEARRLGGVDPFQPGTEAHLDAVILSGRMREGQDDEKTSQRCRGAAYHRATEIICDLAPLKGGRACPEAPSLQEQLPRRRRRC